MTRLSVCQEVSGIPPLSAMCRTPRASPSASACQSFLPRLVATSPTAACVHRYPSSSRQLGQPSTAATSTPCPVVALQARQRVPLAVAFTVGWARPLRCIHPVVDDVQVVHPAILLSLPDRLPAFPVIVAPLDSLAKRRLRKHFRRHGHGEGCHRRGK